MLNENFRYIEVENKRKNGFKFNHTIFKKKEISFAIPKGIIFQSHKHPVVNKLVFLQNKYVKVEKNFRSKPLNINNK